MKLRRLATIALSNRDFDCLADKLAEAARWLDVAAAQGAQLAVLPECLNFYCGDGAASAKARPPVSECAMENWQRDCAVILAAARGHGMALTVPVLLRENGRLHNCFFLVGGDGRVLGRYNKTFPTDSELDKGVVPGGPQAPIEWDGVKVGGGICFDMNFADLFEDQKARGAELFLCPSLFPGGDQVNHFARALQRPFVVSYPAWSRIVDGLGREVAGGGYRHETLRFGFGAPVYVADLNFDRATFHFDYNQQQIVPLLARYGREVRVDFSQENVVFALESLSPRFTVQDLIAEFKLLPYDTYFARARKKVAAARGRPPLA